MGILHMERIGGLVGLGTSRARLRSHGQLDTQSLSTDEAQAVEQLFKAPASPAAPDTFTLRLTRSGDAGTQSVVVPESAVPANLLKCLKDEWV
jgi:hypothetical protein